MPLFLSVLPVAAHQLDSVSCPDKTILEAQNVLFAVKRIPISGAKLSVVVVVLASGNVMVATSDRKFAGCSVVGQGLCVGISVCIDVRAADKCTTIPL